MPYRIALASDAMDHETLFREVVEAAGGLTELANKLSDSGTITPQRVSNWRSTGVPPAMCKRVEAVTGISVRRLRPDDWADYWPEAATTTATA